MNKVKIAGTISDEEKPIFTLALTILKTNTLIKRSAQSLFKNRLD